MLKELVIENLAVIEKCAIQFDSGFNVFTGETGAGKSVIIGAINAILGSRINKDIVREGSKKASITAVFDNLPSEAIDKLKYYGYDFDEDELILQREITCEGKSSSRICGRPASVSVLKDIALELVNIHGQHETQTLFSKDKYIDILDKLVKASDLYNEYGVLYKDFKKLRSKYDKMLSNEGADRESIDFLKYQLDEIENADIKIGEIEHLESERKLMLNYEKIIYALKEAYLRIQGSDDQSGSSALVSQASDFLTDISDHVNCIEKTAERLQEIYLELSEISADIYEYMSSIEIDNNRLNILEQRLDLIYKLRRKYGNTDQSILEYRDNIKAKIFDMENYNDIINEIKSKLYEIEVKLTEKASLIHDLRKKAGTTFVQSVTKELEQLDMPDVTFDIIFDRTSLSEKGYDKIDFVISANKGSSPKSISKIASGGELSRIMLAVKTTLTGNDNIGTLVFDEVDAGISGSAAHKTGIKMYQISKDKQIICVTHLAQIASMAHSHFFIKKNVSDGKTYTNIKKLDNNERKYEIARIIGNTSDTALDVAQQMIDNKNKLFK